MKKNFVITIVFPIICVIISGFLIFMANNQFLNNAKLMGEEIASNLVNLEENAYISNYENLLKTIGEELNSIENINLNTTSTVYSKYEQIISENQIDIYIVKNGEMYIYNEGIEKGNLGYETTEWYKKAIEGNGEMVSTDIYTNQEGARNITFSLKINEKNDVVAATINIDKIVDWPDTENLPEGARYYICDSQGNVIHFEAEGINLEDSATKEYFDNLFKSVKTGEYEEANSHVVDRSGEKRGVYYAETSNGWNFIITIPYSYLLRGIDTISFAYYGTIAIFAILIIYLIVEERKLSKNQSLYNRITKALGDSYYALYLVNLETGTYSMLKASDHVRATIPQSGKYQVFMNCLETVIEKEAYKEFKEAFSITNMKNLVKKKVRNFGGDFKRIFNSEVRWINVRMLYNETKEENEKNEVVIAFQDISYEKERDLEKIQIIQESIEATESAVEVKNKFFANMSHDMRTPLNAIINLSKLADTQIDNKEKLKDYLGKIEISSKQLLELVNDVLDVSKMEEGITTVNKSQFNILELLQETLSIFEEEAKIQHKSFSVGYNIKNKYVSGDVGKLRQIINNLVSNALKYTMSNGHISIQITEIEGKFVSKYEFIITDDGIGISKEFLDNIYTPFARETRFHADKIAGTGLGMVVVKNNVQKLNGQIEIKSEPNKGSTFRVTIPLEIIDEISENEKNDDSGNIDLKGRKILIAEDNELNMDISSEVLEMQGVILAKAKNGKEAVEIFEKSKEGEFDAILMDMQMPILDGCGATREIRSLPRKDAKTIPIIAVTANTFAEDIVNTRKAGMNDFVAKPIDFEELKKVLSQYLK